MSIKAERKLILEEQRRKAILGAALGMFFENGYRNTKMEDIAKAAGISKGLIYHYFSSKAELLFAYEDNLRECLDEIALLPSTKETIREFGQRFLRTRIDEDGYIPPLQVYVIVFAKGEMDDPAYFGRSPLYRNIGREYFGPLFQKGMDAGEFKKGDAELFGDIYWHYLLGNLMDTMQDPNRQYAAEPDLDAVLSLFEA